MFSGHKSPVTCGGFTPDGKLAVCGGGDLDPSLRVFDPKNGSCLHSIEGHGFHESGMATQQDSNISSRHILNE